MSPTQPTPARTPADLHGHRPVRALATGGLAAGLLLVPVAAASAHVHVTPDTTAAGSYALLDVRVPNESDSASTTRVELALPTDHPFTYAAVQPVPGWTARVTQAPLPSPVDVGGTTLTTAPRTITWTARGDGIGPGEFQQFPVSVGALPDAGTTLLLPATQTYSDGTVVAWDQPVPASGEEPEHPAPVLTTTAAAGHHDDGGDADPAAAPLGAASGGTGSTGGSTGTWLGATGAVLGAAALAVALLRRRPAAVAR
ncbi:YcnI family copper-binding membrane protein [Quadrisphaera sp. KR29]|uniref:YcnI family copper-binding membrane protein n=1 Tax=Quadrisphaera sp. KR29 TaxID=3461391 RepID=UPI004044B6BA